jgi:hypothetical protein
MDDELVTAAVFGDHTQAVAAKMHLEDAGIPAFLLDEIMAGGLFVLGGATGGIKLQVPKSRLEEAIRLIDERLPGHTVPIDWSEVDVGNPEPEEELKDEGAVSSAAARPAPTPVAPADDDDPQDLTLREQRASKIVRGAFFGIFCWPVLLLAAWRLIQIANSEERLRPEYQRKANIGATIVIVMLFLTFAFCGLRAIDLIHLWTR